MQEAEFDDDLWFSADEDSVKDAQIKAMPEVNVSFSDEKQHSWTSIAGGAEIVHDRAKAEELYSPVLKRGSPTGTETPGLTLIRVEVETAKRGDIDVVRTGSNPVVRTQRLVAVPVDRVGRMSDRGHR